jgi:formate--tetrahydrofolate ligase
MATRIAQATADIVVTEAGFGFDLGAEKFFDIKCRASGLWPSAVVLVATARALRAHGGDLGENASEREALQALERGIANLEHHIESVRAFGFDPVVAINCFDKDREPELAAIEQACKERKLSCARFRGFSDGGEGAKALAAQVLEAVQRPTPSPRFLYALEDSPENKISAVARTIYGASEVDFTKEAKRDLKRIGELGYSGLPICMAKTHLSLSDDPKAVGRPKDFVLTVRQVRAAAGAGYLLALTGDIVTMPGLPAHPAASAVDLTDDGGVVGIS